MAYSHLFDPSDLGKGLILERPLQALPPKTTVTLHTAQTPFSETILVHQSSNQRSPSSYRNGYMYSRSGGGGLIGSKESSSRDSARVSPSKAGAISPSRLLMIAAHTQASSAKSRPATTAQKVFSTTPRRGSRDILTRSPPTFTSLINESENGGSSSGVDERVNTAPILSSPGRGDAAKAHDFTIAGTSSQGARREREQQRKMAAVHNAFLRSKLRSVSREMKEAIHNWNVIVGPFVPSMGGGGEKEKIATLGQSTPRIVRPYLSLNGQNGKRTAESIVLALPSNERSVQSPIHSGENRNDDALRHSATRSLFSSPIHQPSPAHAKASESTTSGAEETRTTSTTSHPPRETQTEEPRKTFSLPPEFVVARKVLEQLTSERSELLQKIKTAEAGEVALIEDAGKLRKDREHHQNALDELIRQKKLLKNALLREVGKEGDGNNIEDRDKCTTSSKRMTEEHSALEVTARVYSLDINQSGASSSSYTAVNHPALCSTGDTNDDDDGNNTSNNNDDDFLNISSLTEKISVCKSSHRGEESRSYSIARTVSSLNSSEKAVDNDDSGSRGATSKRLTTKERSGPDKGGSSKVEPVSSGAGNNKLDYHPSAPYPWGKKEQQQPTDDMMRQIKRYQQEQNKEREDLKLLETLVGQTRLERSRILYESPQNSKIEEASVSADTLPYQKVKEWLKIRKSIRNHEQELPSRQKKQAALQRDAQKETEAFDQLGQDVRHVTERIHYLLKTKGSLSAEIAKQEEEQKRLAGQFKKVALRLFEEKKKRGLLLEEEMITASNADDGYGHSSTLLELSSKHSVDNLASGNESVEKTDRNGHSLSDGLRGRQGTKKAHSRGRSPQKATTLAKHKVAAPIPSEEISAISFRSHRTSPTDSFTEVHIPNSSTAAAADDDDDKNDGNNRSTDRLDGAMDRGETVFRIRSAVIENKEPINPVPKTPTNHHHHRKSMLNSVLSQLTNSPLSEEEEEREEYRAAIKYRRQGGDEKTLTSSLPYSSHSSVIASDEEASGKRKTTNVKKSSSEKTHRIEDVADSYYRGIDRSFGSQRVPLFHSESVYSSPLVPAAATKKEAILLANGSRLGYTSVPTEDLEARLALHMKELARIEAELRSRPKHLNTHVREK